MPPWKTAKTTPEEKAACREGPLCGATPDTRENAKPEANPATILQPAQDVNWLAEVVIAGWGLLMHTATTDPI